MKSKKIIILVVVLLILIGGASFGLLYLNTDLFKSTDDLFYKYLFQNIEFLKGYEDSEYLAYTTKLKEMTHSNSGDISFTTKSNAQEGQEDSSTLDNLTVNIEGKSNPGKNKQYQRIDMKYSNDDFFEIEYMRDQDKYALKSDEIVNKYVAIENKDLKTFAEKMGVEDLEKIPDKIESINYQEVFNLTQEEVDTIKQTYLTILKEQITKDKFTKNKDVSLNINNQNLVVTSYTLQLSNEEVKNIQIKLLEKLKEDDFTLNIISDKMKILNSSEEYADINSIKEEIQKQIEEISKLNDIEPLKITVFVNSGLVVKTEISTNSEIIDFNTNVEESKITTNVNIKELFNEQNEENNIDNSSSTNTSISISKEKQGDQTKLLIDVIYNDGETKTSKMNIDSTYIGLTSGNNVENKIALTINNDETMFKANYRNKVTFGSNIEIEDLDDNNSATLNNFSKDEVNSLVTAISEKTAEVLMQKLTILSPDGLGYLFQSQMSTPIEQAMSENNSTHIQMMNTRIEQYGNNQSGAVTRALINQLVSINNSMTQENNKISLSINDIQYAGKDITNETMEVIQNTIDTNKNYTISFEYNEQTKLISKVIIKENV